MLRFGLGSEVAGFLGDIVWNFNKLQMEFYVKGRRHVLRGASTGLKTVKKGYVNWCSFVNFASM